MRKDTTMIWFLVGLGLSLFGIFMALVLGGISADADERMADEMMRQEKRNLARQKRKTGINIGGEA